jgi:uncharacterized cupin superfamily protein
MTRGKKPVVNVADVTLEEEHHGETFAVKVGEVGLALGGTGLGCMYHEVPAGKRAFPFHVHHVQHELFYILEGTGKYRFGKDVYPIRAGDVCAAPAGGAEAAHQIVNDSDKILKYLGFSSAMKGPEIVEYPDSGKFGVTVRAEDSETRLFRFIGRHDSALDYWDGEE